MSEESEQRAGEAAALRRFPHEHRKIELLIARDGEFCELCKELAAAEFALQATESLPSPVREERNAEWAASIEHLVAQMERALRETNVVRPGWLSLLKILS